MLDAGGHRSTVLERALVAPHHGFAHAGVQVRVLAAAFRDPAPAGIPGDVEHRRERPADALCRRLHGSYTRPLFHKRRIKSRGQAQGNREHGVETMDHVAAHQQGDAEAGLLHRDALEFVDPDRIHLIEDGTDLSLADGIGIIGNIAPGGHLVHLADLLGQGHPGQQRVHALFHGRRRARRGGLLRAAAGGGGQRQHAQK